MTRESTEYRVAYRRASGWLAFAIVAGVTAYLLVDAALRASLLDALLIAPWPLLGCWAVYVFFAAPSVVATDGALRVRNALRVVAMPWERIAAVRLRWQLEIVLRDGSVVAAAGGAPQHLHTRRGAQPGEEQAETLELFRERAEPSDEPVRRSWHVPSLVVLGVLVAWAGCALLATGPFAA